MKHRIALLALALSVVSLPGFGQGLVSSEPYSDNPMNGVGVAHNAYSGCMADNRGAGGAPVEVLAYHCGVQHDGKPEEFVRTYGELAKKTRTDTRLSIAENLRGHRASFGEEQFSYFEDMDQILAEARSAEEADAGLKALEAQAVKNLGRKDNDLAVLGAISTARHSLELWTKDRPLEPSASGRAFPWIAVVVADLTGYVNGVKACGGIKLCGYINAAIQSVSTAFGWD